MHLREGQLIMNHTNEPQALNEIIATFKKDYNTPLKGIIWVKTLEEWGKPIVGALIILLLGSLSYFTREHQPDTRGMPYHHQNVIGNLRLTVKFMNLTKKSINERQELYARLMDRIAMYANATPEQNNLELKIENLTSILSSCNSKREIFMMKFSGALNPLSKPDIAASYSKMANIQTALPEDKGTPLTAESEQQQWGLLCGLCANELQKTEKALAQLLKSQSH